MAVWTATLGWPLLFLLVGFWLVPFAVTCQLQCVPGDLGDARFNGVVLEHFYLWLGGHEASLLSPPYFYPMPGALTFSDNHWGTAWIYAIFRALGWDRYQAYDLWFLFGCLLNFVASHCVFRRLRFSPLASAVAAFAFTFAMPVTARYGHSQLGYRFLIPIGLLLWQSFRESGHWRWLGALSLAVAAQFYISIYLGYFMLLFLAAWVLAQWRLEGWGPRQWLAQWHRWSESRAEPILALLMMVTAVLLIAVLMYPYLHYSKLYGFQRAAAEIASLLPRPQSYLLADSSVLWGGISNRLGDSLPMRHEQQIFFGIGILALMVAGLMLSPRRLRWVALAAIALLVVVTLSVGGVSLYLLLVKLPGVGSIRAMSRIGLVLALPIALLVAIGVESLRAKGVAGTLVLVALSLLMVVESGSMRTARFPIEAAYQRDASLRSMLPASLPADAMIFNPMQSETPFHESELDGVILAQSLGRPTLNGYSGNGPSGYGPQPDLAPQHQAALRIAAARDFFATTLHQPVPKGLNGPLTVIVHAEPADTPRSPVRLSEMDRVAMQIVAMQRQGSDYVVTLRIHNGTDHFLTTQSHAPFRLSWQWFADSTGPASNRWDARVETIGRVDLAPGAELVTLFKVPADPGGRSHLAVSAVLEGRAWLHDHGMRPAVSDQVASYR